MSAIKSLSLSVDLGGLAMKNPVTVASGTFAAGREYSDFIDLKRLGAVTTKGVSVRAWEGNKSPRIAETSCGMLNSIGLQNPGIEAFCAGDLAWLGTQDVPIIVNVSGHTIDEYRQVVARLEQEANVGAYEINISCPNVDAGGMTFGTDSSLANEVISVCRAGTSRPLYAKLSPNVTDITEIARACEAAGADAISMVNTFLGMAIDASSRKPLLARKVGGLSGPAIKPLALRMVWETYNSVRIPILGMGGITNGTDAIEFMLAGATAIAVGTANFIDPCASVRVLEGIQEYCVSQGVDDVRELIGGLLC
ncbi:MAG: dihydroorotate dehydrogenase [Actinobacteria bacterium]|nr:dihydroorotate dehydrogenase [Actinomycetota bacterium]